MEKQNNGTTVVMASLWVVELVSTIAWNVTTFGEGWREGSDVVATDSWDDYYPTEEPLNEQRGWDMALSGNTVCIRLPMSQRLMSRWKYQFSYNHWSQPSWAQPVFRWVKLSGEWGVLLYSNLDIKPTWLLSETGNLAIKADPRVPQNQKKSLLMRHAGCSIQIWV